MADDAALQGYSLRVRMTKSCPVPSPKIKMKSLYERKRQNLKSDLVKYTEYKIKDAINHRKHRKSMNDIQRKIYNQKAAVRMMKYRERKKELGLSEHIPLTRKKLIEQREYWRNKKREQREKLSSPRKKAENSKRRQRYAERKQTSHSERNETPPTNDSLRQAKRRLNFAKKSDVFASVISNLVTSSTPRKKQKLNEKGVFVLTPKSKAKHETNAKIVARLKLNLKQLKANQSKRGKQIYYTLTQNLVGKHIVEKQMRQTLDLKWKHWCKMSLLQQEEIPKFDSMSDETKECIKTYYTTESVTLPTKRTVMKDGTQRKVLTESLQSAYLRFRHQNPGHKISLSSFKKHRPKEILTMNNEKFSTCLCEYCLNIEFKLEAINRICEAENKKHLKLKNRFECVNMSLCEKESDFNNRECYERNCSFCGVGKITTHFQELTQLCGDKTVKWKKWEPRTMKNAGKEVQRQMLVEKVGRVDSLMGEFTEEMKPHANHTFIADWQRKQYRNITQRLPNGWMVSVADFAENYRCINQDEIQSAYYSYQQATLFTLVSHYRCPSCENSTVQESAVFISPDLKHDADAVNHFNKLMNENIKKRVNFEHCVQFSDGCAAQFKSKKPFLHVSEERSHTMERSFFGSRHGKSACDALGGLVKKQAESFVKSRRGTIPNAQALFDFCHENLAVQTSGKCNHKIRTFFYVEEVDRDRKESLLQTVKGTQKFHHVRGVREGVVKVRHLACFCRVCTGGISSDAVECENSHLVGSWEIHSLYKRMNGENQKKENKPGSRSKQKKTGKPASSKTKSQPRNVKKDKAPQKEQSDPILTCSTFAELKKIVAENTYFEELPNTVTCSWTFCNTKKVIDNNNVELVPQDIPLKPNSQLYPATIYGDGNCLSRVASVLAYGNEEKHKEMRKRIVVELTINEEQYLNNEVMKRGKHPDGQEDVPKAFASYSSCYMAQRLTKRNIRSVYEREVLQVRRDVEWMGLWQVASLANILQHPVVLVCPSYGTHNTRKDVHRVFYPFRDFCDERKPLFILWTHINGAIPESEFTLNHFDVLMPLIDDPDEDDSLNSPVLGIIDDMMLDEENSVRFEEFLDSPMWFPPEDLSEIPLSGTPEVPKSDTPSDTPELPSGTPDVPKSDTPSDTPELPSDAPEVLQSHRPVRFEEFLDSPMWFPPEDLSEIPLSGTPEVPKSDTPSDTPELPSGTPDVPKSDTPSDTPELPSDAPEVLQSHRPVRFEEFLDSPMWFPPEDLSEIPLSGTPEVPKSDTPSDTPELPSGTPDVPKSDTPSDTPELPSDAPEVLQSHRPVRFEKFLDPPLRFPTEDLSEIPLSGTPEVPKSDTPSDTPELPRGTPEVPRSDTPELPSGTPEVPKSDTPSDTPELPSDAPEVLQSDRPVRFEKFLDPPLRFPTEDLSEIPLSGTPEVPKSDTPSDTPELPRGTPEVPRSDTPELPSGTPEVPKSDTPSDTPELPSDAPEVLQSDRPVRFEKFLDPPMRFPTEDLSEIPLSGTPEVPKSDTPSDTPELPSGTPEVPRSDTPSDTPELPSGTPEVPKSDTPSDTPELPSDAPEVLQSDRPVRFEKFLDPPLRFPTEDLSEIPLSGTPEVPKSDTPELPSGTPEVPRSDTPELPSGTPEVPKSDTPSDTPELPSGTPEVLQSDRPISYDPGTYVNVSHGKEVIPAVVDHWPYVRFFKRHKKTSLWSEGDILHTVLWEDVICKLDVPNITMKGSRLYYRFCG